MPREQAVFLVVCEGPLGVIGAYWRDHHAFTHARTVTGASVVCVMVNDQLPEAVLDQLVESEFDDVDTPVSAVERR